MAAMKLTFAALLGLAGALSYPKHGLIPKIPGVTVPLDNDLPPLPILQPPTPAEKSPPHPVNKTVKPKKFSYWFVGANDRSHADFWAGYSLDEDTFGTLFSLVDLPTSGNEPHHSGPSSDGKVVWGGGLLSLLKTQDTGFYMDVSDYYNPKFMKSDVATLSSIADDVVAKPDGGFFFTYMGSAVGTAPGRLVETDKDYNIIHQWPEDVEGTLNILGEQFTPHGLNVNFVHGYLITTDFVVPRSVLKPSPFGVQGGNSVRLWDLKTRKILNTVQIPNGDGIQDVKFIPHDKQARALVTAVGLGEVWIIHPKKKDPKTGKPGVAEKYAFLGKESINSVAIFSDVSSDGNYYYTTSTTANHISAFDIRDVDNPKRLTNPAARQPIVGPHFLKVTPDQKHLAVCDYFLQTGNLGIINTDADYKGLYIPLADNGAPNFKKMRTINFAQEFSERGGGRPHSVSVYDLTNPKHPKWV